MGSTQKLSLKWKNHHSNLVAVFNQLLDTEIMVDVTLACDGLSLKAHKIVLSSCSNFFKTLFSENPCQHPIVILKDIDYVDLKTIIEFMYHGKVDVPQDRWGSFLHTAEVLKIKGLTEVASELGGGVQGQKNTGAVARKRKPQESLQKGTSVKQRKVNGVVPVSLQKAKPSSHWQMLELPETSAAFSNKNADEETVLPISVWASEISEKLKLTGRFSRSPTPVDESTSSSNSSLAVISENSQDANSYAPQPSSNISFFTAPIAELQSALEGISEFDVCRQNPSQSQEASVSKRVEYPDEFEKEGEDDNEDDGNYILPTAEKQTVARSAGKKVVERVAVARSSKLAYKKVSPYNTAGPGVEDKALQVDIEEESGEDKDNLENDDVLVLHKFYAESEPIEPSFQEITANRPMPKLISQEESKAVGLPKSRQRVHILVARSKKAASKKLIQAQQQMKKMDEMAEMIGQHVPAVESVNDRAGEEEEQRYVEEEKDKKRERRPPKKYDNFVVGSALPLYEDTTQERHKQRSTVPKNKPSVRKQSPQKGISQKKNAVIRPPLLAERDERIHLGKDVWIEQNDWTKAERTETDRQFCSALASGIWGNTELLERGVTGKALVGEPKRPLSPLKVNIIRERLTDRLVEGNIVPEDISHRVKQVHKYLSDHILSLTRRRERAFMKQRQQQSSP